MTPRSHSVIVLLALTAGIALAQQPRIARSLDATDTATLRNRVHPLARPAYDRGPLDPATKLSYITIAFQPTAAQQSDLENLLIQQQDRTSANFHKWLTPAQFGDRFGLAPSDIAAVREWLASEGFQIVDTARGRNWIAFSGTAGQVRRALHTELHRFEVEGKMHFANASDPSVPAPLASLVSFFRGLDDFEPEPPAAIRYETPAPGYTSTTGTHSMAPDDFATIYDIAPLYNAGYSGQGQSIVVLGRTDIDVPGYQTFRSLYGLPATTPTLHLVGPDPGMNATDLGEAMLDVEWAGAVARDATVIYVYASSINTAAQEAVDKNLAPVISSSYSACEPEVADTVRGLAQQANAQGITWMVVTNDAGAAACEKHNDRQLAATGFAISYPSSIPEITAIGGTMLNDAGANYWAASNSPGGASVLSYIPEVGWNENSANGLFTSTGGVSIFYPKPFWQSAPGVPADKARDVPDISMAAASHDGYRTYHNGLNYISSGTSAATPAFAGVTALLNQYQVAKGLQAAPGMGNINPELYRLARNYPAAFHDITTGNNIVPCVQSSPDCLTGSFGYTAGPGYDLVTGIGSVDVNNLITHWGQNQSRSVTAVSANSASAAFGAAVQLTATVTGAGAVPTGEVRFLVPNRALGSPDLGTATLTPFGAAAATANISVDPNLLSLGANSITAVYSGDATFDVSSGSATVTVTPPAGAAAIVASITPNPVYATASTTGVTSWFYNVVLTEEAGVAATLTGFSIAGVDQSSRLSSFFLNGTAIPAHGTLSASIVSTGVVTPVDRMFTFAGTDANGHPWSQQITVTFTGPILFPEIVLTGYPASVQQNPAADPSCQWQQRLYVQQSGGFNMQLFKFLAGGTDLTSQISKYFGTTEIAPFGALQATICLPGSTPPAAQTYELDGMSDSGQTFRTTFQSTYAAAAVNPVKLSTGTDTIKLSLPSASGYITAPLAVNLSSGAAWTASLYPSNPTTAWLKLAPASGTGSATITLTATAAGQAPGVYRATVILQAANSIPQFAEIPVTFTVGATPATAIFGLSNNASGQVAFAPGMLMSVYGTGLAPSAQLGSVLPLPISLAGVSATVNGIAAPLYYVSPGQINLQIPYEVGAGPAVVGVNNNGALASFSLNVTPSAPGIFAQAGTLVPTAIARAGGVLVLYMTGEGDLNPAIVTGVSPSPATALNMLPAPRLPLTVTVGGIQAAIQFAGLPPFLVGVTQVNFTVPANVPAGVQPVVVTSNGVASTPVNITVTAP